MIKFVIKALLAVSSLVFLIIFGIRSLAGHDYPRPSEAFYVSDFAEMFSPSLENFLIGESEDLYSKYKKEPNVSGIQIVFATFEIDSEEEIVEYDKTKLFNEWKIGKNGMGVLVSTFYIKSNPDDDYEYNLTEIQIATGDRFAEYLGAIGLSQILSKTIEAHLPNGATTYPYDSSLCLGMASFMNELLNVAYGDIYGDSSKVVAQEEFEAWYSDYEDTYADETNFKTNMSMPVYLYFFSSFGSLTDKILFGLFIGAFALFSGTTIKGAGGSSSGAGLFRHRS